ncbi:MAG: gluconate 2-dehydrogenase subunit 3 family protein [Xanthomonadales bacterium]
MHDRAKSRRRFLAETGKLAGGGWLAFNAPLLLAAGEVAAERHAAGAAWAHMTDAEALGFTAVVDQIIPRDDLPGASDAGAVHFLDTVLGDFMAESAPMLKAGLRDLDRRAAERAGGAARFADLSFAQQTELLQAVDETPFFQLMIFLTHCGMFAMPSWGGNRDKAGWALLGFENLHAWQPPFGYYDAREAAGSDHHEQG